MQKREYVLEKQEKNHYCMPAVIHAILKRRNLLEEGENQDKLAEKLKCTPEKGAFFGLDLQKFLVERKIYFLNISYKEVMLKKPELIINQAFEHDEDLILGCLNGGGLGHVRLVTGYEWPNLKTLDPKDAEPYGVSLDKIYQKMWNDKFGYFCLIGKLEK